MQSEQVELKNGTVKTVFAGSKEDLAEAVKLAKSQEAPVYPNINHPVQKGHDLVAVGGDVDKVLVDGTGAHNSPNDAVKPFSTETDSNVKVAGLDESAYKSVPVGGNQSDSVREATEAEVKAARKDSKPADEVK